MPVFCGLRVVNWSCDSEVTSGGGHIRSGSCGGSHLSVSSDTLVLVVGLVMGRLCQVRVIERWSAGWGGCMGWLRVGTVSVWLSGWSEFLGVRRMVVGWCVCWNVLATSRWGQNTQRFYLTVQSLFSTQTGLLTRVSGRGCLIYVLFYGKGTLSQLSELHY